MSRSVLIFLIVVLVSSTVYGSGQSVSVKAGLTVSAGAAVFNNPAYDSVAIVEFLFSISRNQLGFLPSKTNEDSNIYAVVLAQVDLIGTEGFTVDSANTFFIVSARDSVDASADDIKVFDKLSLAVKTGVYSARVTIVDGSSGRQGSYFLDKIIVEPPGRSLDIGGHYWAYAATQHFDSSKINTRLIKSGYYLLPNPLSIFSNRDTLIFLYTEIYNLMYFENSAFQLSLKVKDKFGGVTNLIQSERRTNSGQTAAIVEAVKIKSWPTGLYEFSLNISDSNQTDSANFLMRIISTEEVRFALKKSFRSERFDTLSITDRVNLVTYELSRKQRSTLQQLTDRGKEEFLRQFWVERKSQESDSELESQAEILSRYIFVNERYSLPGLPNSGWKTDRGRVYMQFGQWDELDDHQSLGNYEPFQIWHYHRLNGKLFVFQDKRGDKEYNLVHSNVSGERYDPAWENRIKQGLFDFD